MKTDFVNVSQYRPQGLDRRSLVKVPSRTVNHSRLMDGYYFRIQSNAHPKKPHSEVSSWMFRPQPPRPCIGINQDREERLVSIALLLLDIIQYQLQDCRTNKPKRRFDFPICFATRGRTGLSCFCKTSHKQPHMSSQNAALGQLDAVIGQLSMVVHITADLFSRSEAIIREQ